MHITLKLYMINILKQNGQYKKNKMDKYKRDRNMFTLEG